MGFIPFSWVLAVHKNQTTSSRFVLRSPCPLPPIVTITRFTSKVLYIRSWWHIMYEYVSYPIACACIYVYIYQMCSRGVQSETVFTEIEIDNEGNIHFLKNSPLDIQHTFSSKVYINRATSGASLCRCIPPRPIIGDLFVCRSCKGIKNRKAKIEGYL